MNLAPLAIQKFFANNGRPLAGGLLFTYVSGTDTKIATYVDASGVTPNTNPIDLDFRGECRLWLDPSLSYKFILSPPGDTDPPTRPIWTVDDITVAPVNFENSAVDTGTVNNISLSLPAITAVNAFTRVIFKAANTNTGPTTLQINGGSAYALTWQNAGEFGGGEIQQNGIYEAIFDGAQWQLQGPTIDPTQVRTPAEISEGVTPENYAYLPGNLWRYMTTAQINDAVSGGLTVDCSASFTTALSCNEVVSVPDGTYRTDTAVTVEAGKMLSLSHAATLVRVSAASATTPVVYVLGIKSALDGGTLSSEKASPNGVVCLGHIDNMDDRQAYWWRFTNCNIQGRGQAGDVGVNVPSGQAGIGIQSFNYFGCIENINIIGADIGLLFREYANAHNAANLQYWECRTACLELRGAYGNNVSNQFFHTGLVSGLISILLSNKTIGTQNSQLNNVIGFTSETLGAADISVAIESEASTNTIIGNSNVLGGFSVQNADNLVVLSGIVRYCTQADIDVVNPSTNIIISNTRSGTRDSLIECNNSIGNVSAGATLVLRTDVQSGILTIRNASDGGSAAVLVDSVTGCAVISDPGSIIAVGADPGAGSSKFWVVCDGTSTRITNRFAAPKSIDVLTNAAS